MLKYYKVKRTLHYKQAVRSSVGHVIMDEEDIHPSEVVVTWENLDEYADLVRDTTRCPIDWGRKYRKVCIDWDWIVNERRTPNLKFIITTEYIEEIPSFKTLIEYSDWQRAYKYIASNIECLNLGKIKIIK